MQRHILGEADEHWLLVEDVLAEWEQKEVEGSYLQRTTCDYIGLVRPGLALVHDLPPLIG